MNDERTWTFKYSLPARWFAVNPQADSTELITTLVDHHVMSDPSLAPSRDVLVKALATFAVEAGQRGAAAAAFLATLESGIPVLGELLAISLRGAAADVNAELDVLAANLRKGREGDITPREVEIVDLPAGRAIRVRLIGDLVDPRGRETAVDSVQYWVPVVHEHGHDVLLLSGGTPTLAAAEQFATTFDEIARSLRFAPV